MRIAKLPFVLIDWEGFASGAACFSNGKTIVFGLVGGYFGVEIAKWALEIRIRIGDSYAVPVAIGRLACFSAGCCYYRFANELIRPEAKWAYGLTGYQRACLALIPVFVGLWIKSARGFPQLARGRCDRTNGFPKAPQNGST